ncbi:Uncharacterized protein BM_BM205, partial [Brugia malayi]
LKDFTHTKIYRIPMKQKRIVIAGLPNRNQKRWNEWTNGRMNRLNINISNFNETESVDGSDIDDVMTIMR